MNEKLIRYCPECNKEIVYATIRGLNSAFRNNTVCRACVNIGRIVTEETRNKIGKANSGKDWTDKSKKIRSVSMTGIGNHRFGKHLSADTKSKISKANIGRLVGDKNPAYGLFGNDHPMGGKENKWGTHSDETKCKISEQGRGKKKTNATKRKMRMAALRNIEARCGQVMPNYNSSACIFIDDYGKRNGFHFQHAENGGEFHIKELGYFVDGFDAEKNVVIEYYELAHLRFIERDEQRKQEIIEHLGCEFIELKEWETN